MTICLYIYTCVIWYVTVCISKHKDCIYYHSKLPFTWPGRATDVATNWDTQTAEGGPSVTCGDGHTSQSNNKDSLIRAPSHSEEVVKESWPKITATIWYLYNLLWTGKTWKNMEKHTKDSETAKISKVSACIWVNYWICSISPPLNNSNDVGKIPNIILLKNSLEEIKNSLEEKPSPTWTMGRLIDLHRFVPAADQACSPCRWIHLARKPTAVQVLAKNHWWI